ncbi:mavicyanin-like [Ricinus communis]|uniref:mavicyanin-like n=1 Tax=Ricinus communis TaxID=3988 RepID=UPI000772643B|nr:mavicyanin-like [Ricinus communis]|eukprot:XP_015584095.1 mavicyanin-like [Ricinus communis]
MASFLMGSCKVFLFSFIFYSILLPFVTSTQFLVGGDNGWTLPKKDDPMFNDWASRNRFKVNDTVYFKYEKDSVMVVTEEEYKKCRSAHPIFFSNNGDTVFMFDRPGLFYFISGVNGHCERGQKMIIKVLEIESPPPDNSGNQTDNSTKKNGATEIASISSTITILLSLSFLGLLLL